MSHPSQFLPRLHHASSEEALLSSIAASERWLSSSASTGDDFERKFVIDWLTRSLSYGFDDSVTDNASKLLASLAGKSASGPVTRQFSYNLHEPYNVADVHLQIRNTTYVNHAIGFKTWGSAPLMSELLQSQLPSLVFKLSLQNVSILEIGAGTGLVGIATAHFLGSMDNEVAATLRLTDYHPDVLSNLAFNISQNPPSSSNIVLSSEKLDWKDYHSGTAQPTERYDIILGADLAYETEQIDWFHSAVQQLLKPDGIFLLTIPLRPTHLAEVAHVEKLFSPPSTLQITDQSEHEGPSDGNELRYRFYTIRNVQKS